MASTPWLTTEGSALLPLAFVVGFLCVSLALGLRLLKMCGASAGGSHAERGVIAICLGAGILQFVPFGLGVAGQFNVTALRIAAVVAALLAVPDLLAAARSMRSLRRPDAWVIAWILALSPAAVMAALAALTPSLDVDGVAYHLTVPKRWMSTGHLDYLPTYPYSNSPMGLDLLFGWAMALAGDTAAKCIHLTLGLLAVAAIYLAGKRLQGPMIGAVAATLFLVAPLGIAGILGYSYVEGGAALATASAVVAWLVWFQMGSSGFLRVAALLAGIAVSFKNTTALFPVALGALSLIALYERNRDAGGTRPGAAALTAVLPLLPLLAAPVLPWFARALILTGNPFFPLLASIIPSRDLSSDLAAQVDAHNRYMTWGTSLGREWTLEQRTHVLLAVALVLVVIGVFAWLRLRRGMARATAVVVTVAALGQLFAAGLYLRYWLPVAGALMLPILMPFGAWLARRWVTYAWLALALTCSVVQARRIYYGEGLNLPGVMATLAGTKDRRDYLAERIPIYPLYERINRDLPEKAGVMLSVYCGGFYIDRSTFCAEMVQESLRFTTWEEFSTDVRRLGITHLIAPSALATGGPTKHYLGGSSVSAITREAQFRVVSQLLTQHARLLQAATDQGLYEIDPVWLSSGDVTKSP